jgi:hypothetical protein
MELWEAINAGLEQSVEEFIKAIDTGMERSQRIVVIGAFLESYYDKHGKHPNNEDTERLADACLWEELRDSHPDKVTNTEYPFFSEHQLKLRDKRLAGGVDVESIGSDRKDHRPPFKKPRTFSENEAIERARKKAKKKSK